MPASCAATEITKTGVVSSTENPTSTRRLAGRSSADIADSGRLTPAAGQQVGAWVLPLGRGREGLDRGARVGVDPLRHGDLDGHEQVTRLLARLVRLGS